jgi:hypothetical protein
LSTRFGGLGRGYDAWATRGPDVDDGPCGAQSPDGRHTCSLAADHAREVDHALMAPVERYTQVTEQAEADYLGARIGDWITTGSYGGEEYVAIASWPQRDDDVGEDGELADRKAQWAARHAPAVTT